MAKKKVTKKQSVNKQTTTEPKISAKEMKRRKLSKYGFYGLWILWALSMIPFYLPHTCAAFFDAFECPVISAVISIVLGSLFCAFVKWIVYWIVIWLYFYHRELTWKNIVQFFKE